MSEMIPATIERRAFVAQLLQACPQALVITGLGTPGYDAFAGCDRPENFYLWGAMGGAAPMGLGLALARPDRPVLVLTGDGEQLMGIGSLATIGVQQPDNLSIVVLDNGHYGETGMQRSHTSLGADLVAIASGCGLAWAERITDMDSVHALAERINRRQGCGLAQVLVRAENLPRTLPPRDSIYLKNRFRAALGLATF